jgi:ribosomal protein S18 acetylase RimI-like enzyme
VTLEVDRVTEASEELVAALERLVPQLSPRRTAPSRAELQELVAAPGTHLLVARDGGTIAGTLTLIVYRVPTGLRGWIHDVVVDEAARGRGIGEALTHEALRLAENAGVTTVHLTTRVERAAANRLYPRLGFDLYETNVYVWRPH